MLQDGRFPVGAWTDLLDQSAPPVEAMERPEGNELDEEGSGDHVPRKRIRVKAKTVKTEGLDNPYEEVFTIHEEKDHESWRFHRLQKLKRQRQHSHLVTRGVGQEVMVARISIPVFEDGVFHTNMDATTFVNTALRRKTTETSYFKMTEEEAAETDEAKSRELAEWIQEEEISQIREGQELPESRLLSLRWVLPWKPSDEHPQGRKAKGRIVVLGYQHPEVAELKVASPTLTRLGKCSRFNGSIHSCRGAVCGCQVCVPAGRWKGDARNRRCGRETSGRNRVCHEHPFWDPQ